MLPEELAPDMGGSYKHDGVITPDFVARVQRCYPKHLNPDPDAEVAVEELRKAVASLSPTGSSRVALV